MLEIKEGMTVEFKSTYIEEVKKTVVAFANTQGGAIYIGVEDDGKICGVENSDEIILQAASSIRDSIKPDVTLFTRCEAIEVDKKTIVKITVQKGASCPYYLAKKGLRPEGVYVRQGASSVPSSESFILKMIKETDGEQYEDIRSLRQDLTFDYTAKEFSRQNILFKENQYRTLKLLSKEGLYTNLALLLSDQCPHNIKLATFEGINKTIFKDRAELQGSLLEQLNNAYKYISQYNGIHAETDGLYRVDTLDYPIESVREALLNSLVHRDYAFSASTLISIFDDRIEFVSIGGLVKGITLDDVMLGVSVCRNEGLANIFYRLKLIEAYGTGIPKIFEAYHNQPVHPDIQATENAFKIILPNINYHRKYQNSLGTDPSIISLFRDEELLSRKQIQERLGISQATTARLLKKAISNEIVDVIGRGKNTRYRIKK